MTDAQPSVEIRTVAYTVSADYLASVGGDFDARGVDDAVLDRLNADLPEGVVVHRDGRVFATPELAATAREIDFDQLLADMDLDQILSEHGR
ncbi:hypothetical protein ACFT5B_10465 [Luteimicrobium sp. NPDC057192]|jgi:hypothetical protein|uniref:hypothetical protein n=1 Tax=Luteimicrobium sp. NPDC057192 TaxID=3346042 RepID=UPI002CCCB183|nr:hypothetical protein [Luteimicrobium sp.]